MKILKSKSARKLGSFIKRHTKGKDNDEKHQREKQEEQQQQLQLQQKQQLQQQELQRQQHKQQQLQQLQQQQENEEKRQQQRQVPTALATPKAQPVPVTPPTKPLLDADFDVDRVQSLEINADDRSELSTPARNASRTKLLDHLNGKPVTAGVEMTVDRDGFRAEAAADEELGPDDEQQIDQRLQEKQQQAAPQQQQQQQQQQQTEEETKRSTTPVPNDIPHITPSPPRNATANQANNVGNNNNNNNAADDGIVAMIDNVEDDGNDDEGPVMDEARCKGPQDVTRQLLNVFQAAAADPCAMVPERLHQYVPSKFSCQPTAEDILPERPRVERRPSYYNEQFAMDFLDELLNVGYALVYHQQAGEDWVGRSVTLVLRLGSVDAVGAKGPRLEWSSMGGGQQTVIETKTVPLLELHSITMSQVQDLLDQEEKDEDEMSKQEEEEMEEDVQCLFTITTKDGNIFVLEAITPDESHRLVTGIKNLLARLSKQLISGDPHVLNEFYSVNTQDPHTMLNSEQALLRLSHVFLDS